MTTILPATDAGLAQAAEALRNGETVVIPTETVYGLAADATRPDAVAAVFAAKSRPADDPLIVHVAPGLLATEGYDGLVALGIVTEEAPTALRAAANALMDTCWPGPLTLVLPRGPAIPPSVSARLPTVAVRMPAHPVARALIETAGLPLVAPSANLFGRISPTSAEAALTELDGRVPWIVDGGRCDVGVESTVVRVDADGGLGLLRPGAITAAELARIAGTTPYSVAPAEGTAGSPGRLLRHYAPSTPLVVVRDAPPTWTEARWQSVAKRLRHGRLAYAAWTTAPDLSRLDAEVVLRTLAPTGAVEEAAHALYAMLRELDEAGCDLIIVEQPSTSGGLSDAVADRLRRAAHGSEPLG